MQLYSKTKLVVVMRCFLSQNKLLNMEDSFVIAVVHKNIKWLCCAVNLRVPLEIFIHFQVKFDSQQSSRYGLDVGLELDSWKFIYMCLYCFT